MISSLEYFIPSSTSTSITEVKKSKFISSLTTATSKDDVLKFFHKIKDKYPGADHNCFAYIIGNPQSPMDIGSNDDGEPSGTAGKPMLSVLQYRNIGNVMLVVTRFFGGVKLGTGGLVKAYASSATIAVENVSLKKFSPSKPIKISLPFQFESAIRHLLATYNLDIIDLQYFDTVLIEINVPEKIWDSLKKQVLDATQGAARFILNRESL